MSSCLSLNITSHNYEFCQQAWKPIKKQFLAYNLKRKNTQFGQEIQKRELQKIEENF